MNSAKENRFKDKYQYLEYIKEVLEGQDFIVHPWEEISYGVQFEVGKGNNKGLLRIYESKKGIRLDSSQIKDESFRMLIESLAQEENHIKSQKEIRQEDPEELIGIDESGKGDYFGPLVIAAVFTDSNTSSVLKKMGVDDSKKLSDGKIREMALEIKSICPHDVVVIGNQRYNKLYDSIGNLNELLAWGHARVLENLLSRVDCGHALSDQFGRPELIKNALMSKGKAIDLKQRHRAEENIAVAAASVLARYEFIVKIDELEKQYGMEFPKGASAKVINAALDFVQRYGEQELEKVAKMHFKTTNSLLCKNGE